MNKEEVLKQLFLLPKEDILDILEIINGYKCCINKSKKDTISLRSVCIAGYHSTNEFYKKHNITKDHAIAKLVVSGQCFNVKTFLELQKMLNFDDEMLLRIIKESDVK